MLPSIASYYSSEHGENVLRRREGFFAVICGAVLLVLVIIPLSTRNWEVYEYISGNFTDPVSTGLWVFCRRNGCVHFNDKEMTAALRVVIVFFFFAMFSALTLIVFGFRLAFGKVKKRIWTSAIAISISICMFLAMVTYSAQSIEDNFPSAGITEEIARTAARSYGSSCIIGWITFILSLLASVFIVFGRIIWKGRASSGTDVAF